MSWIDAEMSRLKGLNRVLTRERDELKEQLVAVQEMHDSALSKERERVNFWMSKRDDQFERAVKAETERDELRRLVEGYLCSAEARRAASRPPGTEADR